MNFWVERRKNNLWSWTSIPFTCFLMKTYLSTFYTDSKRDINFIIKTHSYNSVYIRLCSILIRSWFYNLKTHFASVHICMLCMCSVLGSSQKEKFTIFQMQYQFFYGLLSSERKYFFYWIFVFITLSTVSTVYWFRKLCLILSFRIG